MMKISAVAVLFCLFVMPQSRAAVHDPERYGFRDEMVAVARRIAGDGVVYTTVNDGEPAIEAIFESKVPRDVVVNLYRGYLGSEGIEINERWEELLKSDPVWAWSGEISGERKTVVVSPGGRLGITSIRVVSFRNDPAMRKRVRSLRNELPALRGMEERLITSREVFQGAAYSGVFLCSAEGNERKVLEGIRRRFVKVGWRDQVAEAGIQVPHGIAMLQKENLHVSLIASTEDDGETTVLITIFKR